jgi:riboflavin synthase
MNQSVKLMLVPHTLLHTTLGQLKVGQHVNIEFDYLTRIVAHQLQFSGKLNCEVAL